MIVDLDKKKIKSERKSIGSIASLDQKLTIQ
jgi:hypothetical protein